ncbi:MAG TPA: asparagine synthase C-terminal domain-containing protein [Candidatus Nanoarchaeia archaeon]|nr:asparagine synthase C-terminal domain-containing protein [Candidatus Nanoarchaeia archaeon]
MQEIWQKGHELIGKNEWGKLVESLKHKKLVHKKEDAKKILRERLVKAVRSRIPAEKFGVFFSGGVDSSFIAAICKLVGANFVCYTAGFQEGTKIPEDVVEAKKVAEKLGLKLQAKIYDLNEAEEVIKKTVNILKTRDKTDVVSVGVGAVVVAAAEMGLTQGLKTFFSGLGSEEIFAGYERHDQAKDVNAECWSGLKYMWERDLLRDFTIAKELNLDVKTPFLDKDLVEYAMMLPGSWKIVKDEKKVILREAAEEFLGQFAWRKKKAAQYGSCFDKAISKLAKKNGFQFKKEYLESL